MPCHPHPFTQLFAALLGTTSALLNDGGEQCAVVGREAACGIAADKLLTGRRDLRRLPGSAELPPSAAHPGPAGLRSAPDPISNLCSIRWFGGDLARLGLGPANRGPAGAMRAAARRRPRHRPRTGRQGRALLPRRRHQDLEPDAAGAAAAPRGVRPAPRRLPRPSTNAAVALAGLARLTGTSRNRSGPHQHPRIP
jgi:hypothetical protein